MEKFEMNGYKVHVTVKIPHLYETIPTFSYQFLIFNKNGKLMNYPFSTIIAHDDREFRIELKRSFSKYLSYTKVKPYSKSKFLEMVANTNS
ncbi:MAG: hypothetical protein ACFFEN_04270 [Candidatus Thorarchaeota archaeon]